MPNAYQQSILSLRYAPLKRTAETEERILTALETASDQLKRLIGNSESPLSKKHYNQRRLQVAALMKQVAIGLKKDISDQVQAIADEVSSIMQDDTNQLLADNLRADVVADFTQVPRDVLNWVADRGDVQGLKVSANIWADYQINEIETVLLAGMARGESARNLSLKLEQFVLGGGQGMGDSVRSKAMRLARTEINNSYWEARRMSSELSPVVEGIKWELSARHPEWDVCDYLSKQDLYGLGPGVYPPELLPPKPHPNCLCYSIDVLRDVEAWDQPRDVPGLQEQPSDVPLGRRANGFTENYIKRQHDLFVRSVEATEAAYRLSPRPEPIPTIPAPVLPPPEVETVPDFVPAKTFEEAVRFAEDHLANAVVFENAKGKKELTLKNFNIINEGMARVYGDKDLKVDYLGTQVVETVATGMKPRRSRSLAFYRTTLDMMSNAISRDMVVYKKASITRNQPADHEVWLKNKESRLEELKRHFDKPDYPAQLREINEAKIAALELTTRFSVMSGPGNTKESSLLAMAIHEAAHVVGERGRVKTFDPAYDLSLVDVAGTSFRVNDAFGDELGQRGIGKKEWLKVSEYAATNHHELFCEVTALVLTDRSEEVPAGILGAYNTVMEDWKPGPLTKLQQENDQ